MKSYIISFVLLAFLSVSAIAGSSDVSVKDPWVRLAPPNAKVNAAYFMLHNKGKAEKALLSAESSAFAKVELHLSKVENGVAIMEKVAQISVPADGMVELKPGGLHVMLIEPKKEIKEGDAIPLTLTFADGEKVEVEAKVKKAKDIMEHRGSGNHNKSN